MIASNVVVYQQFQIGGDYYLIPAKALQLWEKDWSRIFSHSKTGPSVTVRGLVGGKTTEAITHPEMAKNDLYSATRGRCINWFTSATEQDNRDTIFEKMEKWVMDRLFVTYLSGHTELEGPPYEIFVLFYGRWLTDNPESHRYEKDLEAMATYVMIQLWSDMDTLNREVPKGYVGKAI